MTTAVMCIMCHSRTINAGQDHNGCSRLRGLFETKPGLTAEGCFEQGVKRSFPQAHNSHRLIKHITDPYLTVQYTQGLRIQ